jgi:hypothetical protein
VAPSQPFGRNRDRHPSIEPTGERLEQSAQCPIRGAVAGGVERAHDGSGGAQERGDRDAGGERFVEVEHIEVASPQDLPRAAEWSRERSHGSGRSIHRDPHASADGGDAVGIGGRPLARRNDGRVMTEGAQCVGQAEYLGLDPAPTRDAVRADQCDAHARSAGPHVGPFSSTDRS